MNFVAGALLLFMDEEDAFWCLAVIVEDLLPGYFSVALLEPQVGTTHTHAAQEPCLQQNSIGRLLLILMLLPIRLLVCALDSNPSCTDYYLKSLRAFLDRWTSWYLNTLWR